MSRPTCTMSQPAVDFTGREELEALLRQQVAEYNSGLAAQRRETNKLISETSRKLFDLYRGMPDRYVPTRR